jgi:hypothetical protein
MLTWDYRVFNVGKIYNGGDPWYTIEEVVHKEGGMEVPCHAGATARLGSESLEGLKQQLQRMMDALNHPVIELINPTATENPTVKE